VVNRAWKDVPWADAFFTEDLRSVQLWAKDPAWKDFQGAKVYHALDPSFRASALAADPDLQIVARDISRRGKYWSRSLSEGMGMNASSGGGAINLAHILGGDPIHLLGFDCRSDTAMESNYHGDYEAAGFDRTGAQQYESFRSDFEHWVEPHVRDRRVVNLVSPEFMSAVTCWPRWDRDSFLRTGVPAQTWGRHPRALPGMRVGT
jgi:hypothetical protein